MHRLTSLPITLILLSFILLQPPAMAADEDMCRNGYSSMLLTDVECKNWLATRKDLEQRGDLKSLQMLDQKMQAMMEDRAYVCPCTWDRSLKGVNHARSARF
jgi:hypothetical protein